MVQDAPPVFERLRALRCLSAVVRHGSTVAAAEALHMSQPAVTRAVLDLEQLCQVRLFDRAPRGMVPTAVGLRLAVRAHALLEHLARGAEGAAALAPVEGRRRAGAARLSGAVPPAGLRALVALAAGGSESAAARALGLSQPAVHRALRTLEHLCDASLFQTSPRGARLTEAGEVLLQRVKLALAEARSFEAELAAWRGELRGRLVVGVLPLSAGLVLPQAVDALLRRHPDVQIALVDGTYESLARQLRQADVDLIVGALRPDGEAGLRQEVLFDDDLAVVARADHPCLKQPRLALRDLLAWPWVVPLAGTPASAALARVFEAAGLDPPAGVLQASSPAMTRALVLQTGRLALGSHGEAMGEHRRERLRVVPVPLTGTTRRIGLLWRLDGEPSPGLRVLVDELRSAARGLGLAVSAARA
ncbi:MAG TPA: LysR family transcriptional regulator [Burkholderiaceae bacterium]|nr:LysR family transcriptional regulator [Burkholderiaceae bacterium]